MYRTPTTVIIYALINPIDNRPFYIGQSKYAKQRFETHLSEQRRTLRKAVARTYKQLMLFDMYFSTGKFIEMRILAEVDKSEAHKQERMWIDLHLRYGYKLTNSQSKLHKQLKTEWDSRWLHAPIYRLHQLQEIAETADEYEEIAYRWERLSRMYSDREYLQDHALKLSINCLVKAGELRTQDNPDAA